MANRYWHGGASSQWNDADCWSSTSGGAGGAGVPTSSDNVYFDGVGSGASNCTMSVDASVLTLDFTGYAHTLSCIGSRTVTVYGGTLKLNSSSLISGTPPTWVLTATCSLTAGSSSYNRGNFTIQSSGTVTMQDALSCQTFILTSGTFTTSNYNLRCLTFSASGSSTRTLNLGSSTITIDGANASSGGSAHWDCTTTTNLTLNAGTSTIYLDDYFPGGTYPYRVFQGGGKTYYNLKIGPEDYKTYIYGSNTFNNIQQEVDSTADPEVRFEAGTTTTITSLTMTGYSATHLITIGSITSAAHDIVCTSGTINVNHVSISYSEASGGATFTAGPDATDGGNNTGWDFPSIETFSGSIPMALVPSSSVTETSGYVFAGSISVDLSPSSVVYRNNEFDGTLSMDLSPSHVFAFSLSESGDLPVTMGVTSEVIFGAVRSGSLPVSFGVSSTFSWVFSGYYVGTSDLSMGMTPSSTIVIRKKLKLKDPVVTGGCPRCGTFLYNR